MPADGISAAKLKTSGDFGMSPFLGSSQTSDALDLRGRYAPLVSLSKKMPDTRHRRPARSSS